jgi:hypothetical protein
MVNKKFLIVIGAIILALIITGVVLFLLYKSRWPVKFSLTNMGTAPVTVDIYANDMMAFKGQVLPPNVKKSYEINNHNVPNLRTGKTVTREQLLRVIINIPTAGKVKFDADNVPNHDVIMSIDRAGFKVLGENAEECPPNGTFGSPHNFTQCLLCPMPAKIPAGCSEWPAQCDPPCATGFICCGNQCVKPSTCTPACPAGQTCCSGNCVANTPCLKCPIQHGEDLRNGVWTRAGFYDVSFPGGIPLF